jgi:3-oxoacid CoA-transferase subunit B
VVHRVITDLAVLDIKDNGFELIELAPGVTHGEVAARTDAAVVALS